MDERDLAREPRRETPRPSPRPPGPRGPAQLVLVYLGLDPDVCEVGDLEHRVALGHVLALDDVLPDDVATDRREDRHAVVGLALRQDLVDLPGVIPQSRASRAPGATSSLLFAQERPAKGGLSGRSLAAASLGEQQFADRLVQFGAVELGQRLARLHVVPVKLT